MGVFGIKTVSPVLLPVNMIHLIKKFFFKVTTLSLVPLHSFVGFQCLNIIGQPTFNINLFCGGVKEFSCFTKSLEYFLSYTLKSTEANDICRAFYYVE